VVYTCKCVPGKLTFWQLLVRHKAKCNKQVMNRFKQVFSRFGIRLYTHRNLKQPV